MTLTNLDAPQDEAHSPRGNKETLKSLKASGGLLMLLFVDSE
jgi:hypothetical protein